MAARVRLEGAKALVTGAGAGIGRATAQALAARGATVVVTDIDVASAEKVAAEINERGGRSSGLQLDVTDSAAIVRMAADQPDVDILVCNAGVGMTGAFGAMTMDDWRWIRSINLDGVVECTHAFGPAMVARRSGQVVIIASGLGYTPRATEPAYVTTKAAVLAFAQCLRADWRSYGVGVSAICPGVTNTSILDGARFVGVDEKREQRARKVFKRGHAPESVAKAVVSAINGDRAVVPVSIESQVGWVLHRLAPVSVQQFVARRGI